MIPPVFILVRPQMGENIGAALQFPIDALPQPFTLQMKRGRAETSQHSQKNQPVPDL